MSSFERSLIAAEYPFDLGLIGSSPSQHNLLPFTSRNVEGESTTILFWLQHGWLHYWAFNHEEAVACFQRALDIDDKCVMAHWGVSMANGPNYNTCQMNRDAFPSARLAYDHAIIARKLITGDAGANLRASLSPMEVDLVEALTVRFNPLPSEDDGKLIDQNTYAFAQAMRLVYQSYPSVACVACMYAEALCNFAPWKLWDLDTGAPKGHSEEIQVVVEKGLQLAPAHPGLNHFLVHFMEMSPHPEKALSACAILRKCAPDAGHLVQ